MLHSSDSHPLRRSRRARAALVLALGLGAAAEAIAQEPAPLAGWRRRAPAIPNARPLELKVGAGRLAAQTAPLAARRDWAGWAKLLQERRESAGLRGALLRPQGPGAVLRGAWEDALLRLLRGPAEVLEAHRAQVDPLATELIAYTRKRRGAEAAWRAVVERFPASTPSAAAARRLAERALERGALEEAQLWGRLAVWLGGRPRPARRLWLAARPGIRDDEAGVTPPPPPLRLAWVRPSPQLEASAAPPRRAVVADAERVYLLDDAHTLALDAATGRLAWRQPLEVAAPVLGIRRAGPLLLIWSPKLLRARRAAQGRSAWALSVSDLLGQQVDGAQELVDVCPAGDGAAALARTADGWVLARVDAAGKVAWRTSLWDCRRVHGLRNVAVISGKVAWGTRRAVVEDGRVAALAERVFVNADGLVACVGQAQGELRWVRERLVGLGLAGRLAVRVRLQAGARGVLAVTRAGLLARLDPLDGARRPVPRTPSAPDHPLLLCARPLVVGWKRGTRLAVGARSRSVGELAAAPLWPGAALGDRLAVPLAAGLASVDLTRSAEVTTLPWPLGPARVVASGGRLLLANAAGVAALTLGPAPGPAPRVDDPLDDLARSLGHRDWRVRRVARDQLRQRLLQAPAFAQRAAEQVAKASLEARVGVEEVAALAARYRRWQAIAPKAPPELRQRAIRDGRAPTLRKLRPHLAKTPAAATALIRELLVLPRVSARSAALDLLLAVDVPSQGRLVALVRTSRDPGAKRAACDALIRLARQGGSTRGLEVLVKVGFRSRDLTVFFALKAAGDAKLFEKVKPPGMKQTLKQLRLVPGAARLAPPDTPALLRALEPWLKGRAK